jgi:hypothetical protein
VSSSGSREFKNELEVGEMGGRFLWVLLLLCIGFFWGQVVSQQQPEEQSESYKTMNSGGGVSRWLSSPSTSNEPGSNWHGKPSRKEELYKRCPTEGTIQAKLSNDLFLVLTISAFFGIGHGGSCGGETSEPNISFYSGVVFNHSGDVKCKL